MTTNLKTFDDLTWYNNSGRQDAQINFPNGWGANVYRDTKWHDGEWRYAAGLLKKGEYYTGVPWDLCYKSNLTPEMVTEWMKKVQELSVAEPRQSC